MGNRIDVRWDDSAKHIILVTYSDGWNWAEFKEAGDDAEVLLGQVTHDVDIIHHVTGAIPTNTLSQIPDIARTSPSLINPQIRYAVVVGMSRYLEIAYRMFRNIYPQLTERLLMCEDIEAAHKMLAEKRAEAS